MGSYLDTLIKEKEKIRANPNSKYVNIKIQKLRQNYSSFISICQDFSIDCFTYSEIFDGDFDSFRIWDTDQSGKIYAHELFSGLILFGEGKFESKIQFLFEMFDLNEQQLLSYEALQLLIINCCTATLKVFQIQAEIVEKELEEFMNKYFCLDSQITKDQFISWTLKSNEITQFFQAINKQIPKKPRNLPIISISKNTSSPRQKLIFKQPFFNIYRKQLQDDYSSITPIHQYLQQPDFSAPITQFHPKNQWIFGIRCDDIRYPIDCLITQQQQAGNQKLLYFVGCIAIIYYPKLETQQYYFNHKKQISCLKISKNKKMVATGEHGQKPQIHIWGVSSRQTIKVLSEIHLHTIVALEFVSNDNYLVSASDTRQNYPFVVQNIQNGQLLFSGQLTGYFITLLQNKYNLDQNSFTFVCDKAFYNFIFTEQVFVRNYNTIPNLQDEFIDAIQYHQNNDSTLILSSANNKLYFYTQKQFRVVSLREKAISIRIFNKTVFAISQTWLYQIEMKSKSVKNTKLAISSQNDSLIQLISNDTGVYLLTSLGLLYHLDITTKAIKKFPQVFKLEPPKAVYNVQKLNQLYYSSGRLLWIIDTKSKQLKSLTSYNIDICSIYLTDDILILGSQQGQLLIYKDNSKQPIIKQFQHPIRDISLVKKQTSSNTNLLVLVQKSVIVVNFDELVLTKEHKIENIKLNKIAKSSEDNLVFGMTSQRELKMFKAECETFKQHDGSKKQQFITTVIDGKPIIFHPKRNILLVAGRKGKIHFWNDYSRAKQGKELIQQLGGHASQIFELIEFNQFEGFISIGSTDQMIALWKSSQKHKRNVNKPKSLQKNVILQAEFNAGLQLQQSPEQLRDSFAIIKPITDKCHNQIIQQILLPENNKYQPLLDKNKSKDQFKLAPLVSIKLCHVLGVQCYSTRKSLFYCHSYKSSSQNLSVFPKKSFVGTQSNPVPSQLKNQILYSKQRLISYIQSHQNCNKGFIYFVDRICVCYSIQTKRQIFYEHHKNKITAICMHPNKQLVCSVESPSLTSDSISSSINKAKIHIWNSLTRRRLMVIDHFNSGVVHRVEFSRNGKYLCTLTKLHKQNSSSIQIYDWENDLFIAQRIFPKQILLDFQFNPYKPMEIVVVGVGMIAILEVTNTLLVVKEKHCHSDSQTITCLSHVYNCYGDTIESDIITGNEQGDISLLICGKYIKVKQKAHNGVINCLKVGELFHYMIVLITGGEDKYLKIWNTKMNIIISINIRNLSCFGGDLSRMSEFSNYAPQSIDLYNCFTDSKQQKDATTDILIGTRGGDIIQLTLRHQYQDTNQKSEASSQQEIKQKTNQLEGVIRYDPKIYMRNASSTNIVGFTIYKEMMLTFNDNECIFYWDLFKKQLINVKKVRSKPSVIKFSTSGEVFVIGYITGEVQLFETNFEKEFIPIQIILNPGASVVNIFFSISDKKMAVSLIYQKPSRDSGSEDFNCEVRVYTKNQGKDTLINRKDINKFVPKIEINNKNINKNMGVHFMDFSTNEKILLLHYQSLKNNKRSFHQRQNKFVLWNIQSNQMLSNFQGNVEFNHLNFSNVVNISYNYRQLMNNNIKQDNLQSQVSQMTQYERSVFLGMTNGQIILSQASAFYNQKTENSFGKIYKAHSSKIQHMKVSDGYLYTSGFNNKSIMCWKLEEQKEEWDYDSSNMNMEDNYCEKYTKQRLNKYMNDVFPKRKNIFQVAGNVKSEQKLGVKIKLNKILGRNAMYKRNNLFYDFNDHIITHSGCNILIMNKGANLEQKVAQLDKNLTFSLPEISSMTISNDRQLLAIGTFSQQSKIFIWNISSQTTMFELELKQIVQIHHLRFSYNCKFIVCTGLSVHNSLVLFLVDVTKSTIIACHDLSYTVNTKIHDLLFIPDEQSKFVTCGLHNVTGWNYSCGLLNSDIYEVETQQNIKHQNKQPINFYSMIFVKDVLITAAADGHIYIWKDKKSIKKQSAHPGEAVLILHTTIGSQIFASGGTDGRVIFWQLSVDVVQKLSQFEVYQFKKQIPISIKHHIQSIYIGRQKMVVGTRCGDIYEFDKPKQISGKSDSNSKKLILPSFNHQKIMSICFSSSSRLFYLLTQKGCFQIYELETLNKLYSKELLQNVQHHKSKSVLKMFVCLETDLIYIIYKQQVEVYELKKEKLQKSFQQTKQTKDILTRLANSVNKEITEAMLSPNERNLALLINSDKNFKIVIYSFPKFQKQKKNQWFKKSHTIQIFSQLHFFDFSNDSNYLLRVHTEDSFVLDLKDFKEIPSTKQEQVIEWVEQGKLKLEAFKDITSVYRNAKHKLMEVVQIMDKCVVVTDEIGSLLVFGYPAKGYIQAKFYHLNNIYLCKVSPDNKTLITISQYDRSIHIWNIQEQDEQLKKKRTFPSIFQSQQK